MDLSVIAAVFAVIFLAELGDKTQLVLLAMGSRLPCKRVLAGAMAAFFLLNLLAVLAGSAVYRFLPLRALQIAAGSVMAFFGLLALLREGESGDEARGAAGMAGPFLASFLMMTAMELGDKTQLSLVALSARYGLPASVFLGGTAALWTTSAAALLLGSRLLRLIPPRKMRAVAGVVFIVFGLAMIMGIA